jgi:hypothetical protein
MLAFFRKYERTMFLIVFAPAILGMGVTSVIVTVLTRDNAHFSGKVFGEPVSATEWEAVVRPYVKMRGREEDQNDATWKFFAEVKAAERAGIRVPEAKLGQDIVDESRFDIAQLRAADRIRSEGVDTDTQEGTQKFRQYVMEALQNPEFTAAEYRQLVARRQMSIPEYEGHQRRERMRAELKTYARSAATVAPEEIWKNFRDKNQTRSAELVTLDAAAYVPSSAASVNADDVKRYYEASKDLWDEPRRVDIEYVAAPFEKTRLEVAEPTEAALKDYFDKHQDNYHVGGAAVAPVDSFENVRAKVLEAVKDDLAKDRAESLAEQVAAKLDEQRKAGKVDLETARAAVAAANTNTTALVHGSTGLLESDQISTHPVLNGFAAYRWANTEPSSDTRTSEPLQGEKCACVLRTVEVKERRSPPFSEVEARVRDDYLKGNEKELKRYYDQNASKYRTKDKWKVSVLVASYDEYAKDPNIDDPSDDDLKTFFNVNGARLWPGKAEKDVTKEEKVKAWKYEKAKANAQADLKTVRDLAKDSFQKDHRANVDIVKNDPKVKKAGFLGSVETVTLDRDDLGKHAVLKRAAMSVPIQAIEDPSEIYTADDEKSQFFFVVKEKVETKLPDLAEVKDQVTKDLLVTRGFDRAREAADKLVGELKELRGDALTKRLAEKGLTAKTTEFFERTATMIPGMGSDSARIVGETFACEPEGGFEKTVLDRPGNKVVLVRCAARKDPPDSELVSKLPQIRHELLMSKRDEFAREFDVELELKAKGISPEHVKWVRARRDGPNGRVQSKVRQIFVPDDRATLDAWLDDAAKKKLDEASADLKRDMTWDAVVFKYSEDKVTASHGGDFIDVARGDLVADYGPEFEDKVFALPADGQVSAPIRSKKGFHLVKVTKAAAVVASEDRHRHGAGATEVRMSFKHLLIKTDPVLRGLPDEIAKKARDIAREKIERAKARLAGGEPFPSVAATVGADDDARARGEAFPIDYVSNVCLAALRQPLEPTELDKVKPEELEVAGQKEWHVMLCARDPLDKEPAFKQGPRASRLVFETVGPTQDAVVAAKHELETFQKDRAAEGKDPSFPELSREWKKICERRSSAPSNGKEGAFGEVSLDARLRSLDEAVLARMVSLDPGKRTDVIESKDGFRIIECVSVESKPADDPMREREIGEAILHGTDWADDR